MRVNATVIPEDMADSDSGTHISDITENNPEDLEAKTEERLESIIESNSTTEPKTISLNENKNPQKTENKEAIELTNIKNATPGSNSHISNRTTSLNSQPTPNNHVSQTYTHIKMDPQPTAGQGHCARSNSSSNTDDNHLTIAHVHSAPRVYRKVYGELAAVPKRQTRRQRSLPPRWTQSRNKSTSRGIENLSFNRSFDSFHDNSHGGPRTAYDFMDAEINSKPKRAAVIDIDTNDRESDATNDEDEDEGDTSWAPTGIFAVFIVTLWTAVLKLIDSIEQNGPVKCSEGEEVRLWICAGSLSLVFCLAEITWKKKSLGKALFGTILVFTYMMLGHAEPLSCRLGETRLPEIGKWQAAMNFFFAALLGTRVYQKIAESVRQKKKKRKRKAKAKAQRRENGMQENLSDDDQSSVMRVHRL